MSRLLLLLSLIGAAIYALLIYTHDVLTDEKAEQAQPNHPVQHLSSWGSYPSGPVYKPKFAISDLSTIHSIASSAN